jgi:hypothetical protein
VGVVLGEGEASEKKEGEILNRLGYSKYDAHKGLDYG